MDKFLFSESFVFNELKPFKNFNIAIDTHFNLSDPPPPEHYHDFFEMYYVYEGECEDTIAGDYFSLSRGNLVIIAPYVSHYLRICGDPKIINIYIRKTTINEIFLPFLTGNDFFSDFFLWNSILQHTDTPRTGIIDYIIINTGDDAQISEEITEMFNEQSLNDEYTGHIMENLISVFLFRIIRRYGKSPLLKYKGQNSDKHRYISYIFKNFRTVTLKQLAKHFSVSIAYCSRQIKALTGKNFYELIQTIRMPHSRYLLLSTDMKIVDISYSLGFENPETFIRNFKKYFGITPSQFRNSK